MRASGRVHDAWHTESHLAFTPNDLDDARQLLALLAPSSAPRSRLHSLETILDGLDLDEVARTAKLDRKSLARLLFDTELSVSFLGFSPGFAYLRGLDPRLHLPRRSAPRPRIHRGALAVAGGFAGIYPSATAGGWNLLGRTDTELLDDEGPLLSAGDRVRLVPASSDRTLRDPDRIAPPAESPAFVLDEVRGLAFIEDGGRVGRLHQGVPISGALLPTALARANAAVGNSPGAAGIERYGALRIRALRDLWLATEESPARRLRSGESIDLTWHAERRVGYVALSGGIDVPMVLGGRGTHVRAGFGGLHGRSLRRGDGLSLGAPQGDVSTPAPFVVDLGAVIRVQVGPDLAHFAEGSVARLTSSTFRISLTSDRMGSRLEGGRVEVRASASTLPSAPLVQGAIEVPPNGEPIALGPEHPSTGGYPVIGVVRPEDLPSLLARPLGSPVRFSL
jgi:biotin-dependent carboxylase-like uncharacterized protein